MLEHSASEEIARFTARPAGTTPPAVTALRVEPVGDPQTYAHRLREVLSGAVRTGAAQGFDVDALDESRIPSWFSAVTATTAVRGTTAANGTAAAHGTAGTAGKTPADVPGEVAAGAVRYGADRDEDPWDLQEWLFCFDPQLRRWRWWDATTPDGHTVLVWLDTRGETVIPCEELRWAAYACGARSVTGPLPLPVEDWRRQPSAGLPGAPA
ncbi:hypothetical protein [Kitasatospora aureofaciens]|uniref:hypothetical protein n=1 Tax=Kitasatospora aureofaciens TaxID=1894 RepID=UPI0033CB1D08